MKLKMKMDGLPQVYEACTQFEAEREIEALQQSGHSITDIDLGFHNDMSVTVLTTMFSTVLQSLPSGKANDSIIADCKLHTIDKVVKLYFTHNGIEWSLWQVLFKHEDFLGSSEIISEVIRQLVIGGTCVILDNCLNEYIVVNNKLYNVDADEVPILPTLNREWIGIF